MSLLQEVIEQYGGLSSDKPKAPTDKTDNTSESTKFWPVKAKQGGFVSFGSEWSELLKNENGELTGQEIPVAEDMIAIVQMRQKGICPDHYTGTTECKRCGPVPIWEGCSPDIQGCPWCFNRLAGRDMPKPSRRSVSSK